MGQQFFLAKRESLAERGPPQACVRAIGQCYVLDWIDVAPGSRPLNRAGVRECLNRAPKAAAPMLFGLFVDRDLSLKAIDVVGIGGLRDIQPQLSQLMRRGQATESEAIILAYLTPSNDVSVPVTLVTRVAKLRGDLDAYDLPLLDYLIVGPTKMFGIGTW